MIGIDGNEANVEKRVGVGRYAYEVLQQFYRLRSTVYGLQLTVYLKDKPSLDLPRETDWWKYRVVGPKFLWTQIGLPLALFNNRHLKRRQMDVFFTPTHYAPRFCPCPRVISIMDLSFLHFPEMFKREDLYQLKSWTNYSVKKATKILTISEASKNDIIKSYGVSREKVVVTYPGRNEVLSSKYKQSFSSNKVLSMEDVRRKYGIDGDYILSVGTLQPRKNYVKLIEAFARVILNPPKVGEESQMGSFASLMMTDSLQLVIVGKKGWLYEEILQAPKKFGVEDKVKFLDFVPDEDLPVLYQKAKCFVLVSLYEGFGLPVLEAMSFGCPVIASNVSSLPEVVGEAGILVDPSKAEEITKAIRKVIEMEEGEREETVQKGYQQAKKFSWEKCAKETLEVLEEVNQIKTK